MTISQKKKGPQKGNNKIALVTPFISLEFLGSPGVPRKTLPGTARIRRDSSGPLFPWFDPTAGPLLVWSINFEVAQAMPGSTVQGRLTCLWLGIGAERMLCGKNGCVAYRSSCRAHGAFRT